MRKAWILLILGIWVAALPCLGFPFSWKGILSSLSGLALIFISFLIYKDYKAKESKSSREKTYDNFKQNNDFIENKN